MQFSDPFIVLARMLLLFVAFPLAAVAQTHFPSRPATVDIPLPVVVQSGFDTDDDGWRVVGDAQGGSTIPTYLDVGGNPGGYIAATDDVVGGAWYWRAPAQYYGDRSDLYGGRLTFDLKQSDTSNQTNYPDIILAGSATVLMYDTPYNPGATWTSYSIPLHAESSWKNMSTGKRATEGEMRTVLAALEELQIRGEYRGGVDTGAMDNVVMLRRPYQLYVPLLPH